MKPGDLVMFTRVIYDTSPRNLYDGDRQCWDKFGRLIRGDLTFEFNDIGIVLLTKKLIPGRNKKAYVKILTSRGTGWIFESYIGVVQSSVGG